MERFPGYTLVRTEDCPEQHGTLTVLTHDVSGATVLLVENEDTNKAFGIGFGTFPSDDTGVFHILEHSVLCGSDKYPVKEPFVELLKTSLQTFLNAMTYPAGDGVPRLQSERSGLSQSHGYLSGRGVSSGHLSPAGDLPSGGLAL